MKREKAVSTLIRTRIPANSMISLWESKEIVELGAEEIVELGAEEIVVVAQNTEC